MQQQRAGTIGKSVDVRTRREGGIPRQCLSNVAVGTIDIMIFARQDAVQPVEDMLVYWHGYLLPTSPPLWEWTRVRMRKVFRSAYIRTWKEQKTPGVERP
jgi:hypothetical protein